MAIRILHVLGGLNRGGVEAWLIQLLRNIDRDRFQMDFLVHTDQDCVFDDEARALGARILPCQRPSKPRTYARRMQEVLQEYGPYDIVHTHVAYFSGYVLRVAARSGIPVRIAHSHTDRVWLESQAGWLRQGYIAWMRQMIRWNATHRFAVSQRAGMSLYGPAWKVDPCNRVIHYGVDFTRFEEPISRREVRDEMGFAEGDFVVGHVGNFVRAKNHDFLLDVAAEAIARQPACRFLLVGEGKLRQEMQSRARDLGIGERVTFAGSRGDVPQLMRGAMDAFLFPSRFEGLGLVMIEAQAAGLPCVFSDVVPTEVDVLPDRLQRLSLQAAPEVWVQHLLECQGRNFDAFPGESLQIMRQSPFAIDRATSVLESFYAAACTPTLRATIP